VKKSAREINRLTEKNILLPYQIKWLADRAPVKVAEKSRRIGITWTEAADSALCAAGRNGVDTWYIGYNHEMAREFVDTVAAWARQLDKAARSIEEIAVEDERRAILAYRVQFTSGHKVVALSSRPSNLRGKQGRAVIDEAAFHDDLTGLLKAALAFTLWGGAIRIISTHNGADNPFNRLVNDIRAGRRNYSLHRVTIDDAIADGLYHRICEKTGRRWSSAAEAEWRTELFEQYGEDAEEELLCAPRASGGAYLATALIEERMQEGIAVARWAMPEDFARRSETERSRAAADFCDDHIAPHLDRLDPGAASFLGEDFGRSGDLTVMWPLQLKNNLVRETPFVVELRNIPFKQQEEILTYVMDRLPNLTGAALDARGNGQYLAERAMQRYGSRVKQIMLTADWYRENMPRYKAALEEAKIVLPKDAAILSDHRSLTIERGVPRIAEKRKEQARGEQRHGDSAIAAALAYYASAGDPIRYEYRAVQSLSGQDARGDWLLDHFPITQRRTRDRRFATGAW
jgi:phage FluMu gp28-like protein